MQPDAPTATPTVAVRKLTIVSQPSSGSSSTLHIQQVTPTPEPLPTATPTVTTTNSLLVEPVIFSGLGSDRPCGHADIVAYDGHALRGTPRLRALIEAYTKSFG